MGVIMTLKQAVIYHLQVEMVKLRAYYVDLKHPKGIGEYELVDYEAYDYAISLIDQMLNILKKEEANEKEQYS